MDIVEKIIDEIKERTRKEYIKVIAEPCENMTQFQSKFGGAPYIPDNFEYPYSKTNPEQPLKLLAQINFSEIDFAEIPQYKDFPSKGILQIYINPDDDICGADFDQPANQSDYRVIYHENVDLNADNTDKIPEFECTEYFPVSKQCKLTFTKNDEYISWREEDEFFEVAEEVFSEFADESEDFDEIAEDIAMKYSESEECGHKIGGNPDFTQDDARDENHTIQILQIDSEGDNILWGDCGIAHLFISEESLKKHDFSDVIYTWDCC